MPPRKQSIDQVIAKDAVENVHPETPRERMWRLFVDEIERIVGLIVVVLGLIGTFVITMVNERLEAGAFQLMSAIVTGAIGYFFGKRTGR